MARSCYSAVFAHSAPQMWAQIRSFGDYAWSGVLGETVIEDGKAGDQVGAIRRVRAGGKEIRQRLLMHSDTQRSYAYEFVGPASVPVRNYQATIRVVPVVETGHAFIEWWATFDCADEEQQRWTDYFEKEGFAKWLASLRATMAADPH